MSGSVLNSIKGIQAFKKTINLGAKSDILRYEILYQHGGLYVDTDFECIKKLEELHFLLNFYTGTHIYKNIEVPNGLIACSPKHEIIRQCIINLSNDYSSQDINKIMGDTGPYYFTKHFTNFATKNHERIAVLPSSYFYPFPNTSRYLSINDRYKYIRPESYAIHHWEVKWLNIEIKNEDKTTLLSRLRKLLKKSMKGLIKFCMNHTYTNILLK